MSITKSKIFEIVVRTIIGLFSGLIVWTILFSIPILLLTYESGTISFEVMFGRTYIDNKYPIILGTIIGLIQGLFIGFFLSFFKIRTLINGALYGILANEVFVLLMAILSIYLLSINEAISIFDRLYYNFTTFLTFSVLFVIPAILIGLITVFVSNIFSSDLDLK